MQKDYNENTVQALFGTTETQDCEMVSRSLKNIAFTEKH